MKVQVSVVALFCFSLLGSNAHAQMIGATLDAEWIYPDFGSVLESHQVVVSNSVELPSTTIISDTKFDIDIGANWIEFRFNSGTSWTDSSFNGWLFRDASNGLAPFVGLSLDSFSPGISGTASIVLGFNADEVWADFGGMSVVGNGDWIRLKVDGASIDNLFCFGDGTGGVCPCGNLSGTGEGCSNSTGQGALLRATGTAQASSNDLVLTGSQLPIGVPALFFAGTSDISPGSLFGDGFLCVGGSFTRLEFAMVDGNGIAATSVGIASALGATSGTRNVLQLWFRDPLGPCGGGFNTTGALDLYWF